MKAVVAAAAAAGVAAALLYEWWLRRIDEREEEEVAVDPRRVVAKAYEDVAKGVGGCCVTSGGSTQKAAMGYSKADRELGLSSGADLGLGCGNPVALAALQPGETCVDLGCGAGIDVLLAARDVGRSGRSIGVDMVPTMLAKARQAAQQANLPNAEFRLGEIEHLPLADGSADVVISNCVVNLSPDKPSVCAEVWRVLRAGGRLAISDVVRTQELPQRLKDEQALAC